jgi:hypothetical protein
MKTLLPEGTMRRWTASKILGMQDATIKRAVAAGRLESVILPGWTMLLSGSSVMDLARELGRPVPDNMLAY